MLTAWMACAACAGPSAAPSGDAYTDAMAREHAGDSPAPTPASEAAPAAP